MPRWNRIVILTGAGVSAESGLATFRDKNGLWENHRIEEVATPEAFRRDPALVHRFYNQRRASLKTVQPNAAHHALARLQREFPGEVILVTQNVDDLHERAGSENVVHMHGELRKVRCERCGAVHGWHEDLHEISVCSGCSAKGKLRPHIVWFGEMPFHMEAIMAALERADLFAAVGTSGRVYPAAGFFEMASHHGARTIECNTQATDVSELFDECLTGPAGIEVPKWVDSLLK